MASFHADQWHAGGKQLSYAMYRIRSARTSRARSRGREPASAHRRCGLKQLLPRCQRLPAMRAGSGTAVQRLPRAPQHGARCALVAAIPRAGRAVPVRRSLHGAGLTSLCGREPLRRRGCDRAACPGRVDRDANGRRTEAAVERRALGRPGGLPRLLAQGAFSSPTDPGVITVNYTEGAALHFLALPATGAHSWLWRRGLQRQRERHQQRVSARAAGGEPPPLM